jgi:hypothetical protein
MQQGLLAEVDNIIFTLQLNGSMCLFYSKIAVTIISELL